MTGKVCVVTGGSSGLGSYMAQGFLESGAARVYITARSEDKLVAKAEELSQVADGQCIAVPGDLSDMKGVEALSASIRNAEEYVDVLVNNAGIAIESPVNADDFETIWDKTFAVLLTAQVQLIRDCLPELENSDGGRIINLSSSVVGLLPTGYGVYAASKAAVETLSAILTKELRGRSITVNSIAPGPTATKLFLDGKPAEVVERLSKAAPLERLGQPEDIAASVAFLAGPDGAWVNGQVIRVNGGII